MSDTFKKVTPGQRLDISAEAYNAFLDVARSHKAGRHSVSQDFSDQFRQASIIRVKNDTGTNLKRFSIVGYDDPIVGPDANLQQFQNLVNLKGVVPTDPTKRFCVLLEPLADGAIGRAVAAGVTPVQINVARETDRFAGIATNETDYLKSSKSGPAAILWKEAGTGLKWAVVLLWSDEPLIPFELIERADTLDGFPVDAYRVKPDGSTDTTEVIQVQADPILQNIYGPANVGFRGWATGTMDGDAYTILHMQRFARYIKFQAGFNGGCESSASVQNYWDGEDPNQGGWAPMVRVDWMDCQCLENETGIAVLDEAASGYSYLWYRVVSIDQVVNMADIDECDEGGYSCTGNPIRTLLVGKGLTLLDGSCSGQSCTKVLQADGLEVLAESCVGGDPAQKLGVQTITVQQPLKAEFGDESECLGTVTLGLNDDFLSSDCLDIQPDSETCGYKIDLPDGLVTAGPGIAVAAGQCSYVVSATGVDVGIEEGDCIAFDVSGNTTTINNTMNVVGGNGIAVTNVGCDRIISLAGHTGSPQTTVRFPCSFECVQDPQTQQWQLIIKWTSFDIPTAVISNFSSECGSSGSGSSGSGGTSDPYTFHSVACPVGSYGEYSYISATFNSFEPSATYAISYTHNVTRGTTVQFGPHLVDTQEPGSQYWFIVPEGEQAGDALQVEVVEYSGDIGDGDGGTVVRRTVSDFTCEDTVL